MLGRSVTEGEAARRDLQRRDIFSEQLLATTRTA
jgi:hypothetical protein